MTKILALRHAPPPPPESSARRGKRTRKATEVPTFEVPKPILDAPNFTKMIAWDKEQILEPPYTKDFSDEEIQKFVEKPLDLQVTQGS